MTSLAVLAGSFSKEEKMKKIVCITLLFVCVSCDQLSFPQDPESPPLASPVFFSEPQIYLDRENKSVDIGIINRSEFRLNLSDRIIFSDQEDKDPVDMKPLTDFAEEADLKIRASSFCSYKKSLSEPHSEAQDGRVFQELGSRFYRSSFSVFELLPKETLLNISDQNFYCSFVFAFKNADGVFDHYSIVQQPIQPMFNSADSVNKLYLIRKTGAGHYLPVNGEEIKMNQNLSEVLLVNNTKKPVENYHLFCEGLKIITVSSAGSNAIPLFLNLIIQEAEAWPTGVKKCRVFSENKKQVTGISGSFKVHFHSLSGGPAPNLRSFSRVDAKSEKIRSTYIYKIGAKIPLNSWFQFTMPDKALLENYSAIEVKVETQCVDTQGHGQDKIVSESYSFPFREKFSVMAVTPTRVFGIKIDSSVYDRWIKALKYLFEVKQQYKDPYLKFKPLVEKSYLYNCTYKIKLQDKNNLENKKVFSDRVYSVSWSGESYGVDQKSLIFYRYSYRSGHAIKHGYEFVEHVRRSPSLGRHIQVKKIDWDKKPFLNLDGDIYEDKIGYLDLNFFDAVNDSFLQREGHKLSHVTLKCAAGRGENHNLLEVSWPYSIQNNRVSLRTLFMNSKVRQYMYAQKLSVCRVLFYENKILRYFSEEMVITRNCIFIKKLKCKS